MDIRQIAGSGFDGFLQQVGINRERVRYRDMIINPNPMVSHEGVVPQGGWTNPMSTGEAIDTWTVSVQIEAFQRQLRSHVDAEIFKLQNLLTAGSITSQSMAQRITQLNQDYSVPVALLARQEWWIELHGKFEQFQSSSEGKREAIKYVWKLTLPGL